MANNSKQVADKAKDGESLEAAGEANTATIAAVLKRDFHLSEELTATVMKAILGTLKAKRLAMVSADQAHAAELADDDPQRVERDTKTAAVRKVLVDCRTSVTTAHSEEGAAELGFVGRTPEEPQLLANLGGTVLTQLGRWKPRPSILEDYTFKAEVWKSRLAPVLPQLEAALAGVAREEREADVTRVTRDQATAAYDDAFSKGAGIFAALLEAADQNELARKLRPSTKRSGRTAASVQGEGDVAPPSTAPTVAA